MACGIQGGQPDVDQAYIAPIQHPLQHPDQLPLVVLEAVVCMLGENSFSLGEKAYNPGKNCPHASFLLFVYPWLQGWIGPAKNLLVRLTNI